MCHNHFVTIEFFHFCHDFISRTILEICALKHDILPLQLLSIYTNVGLFQPWYLRIFFYLIQTNDMSKVFSKIFGCSLWKLYVYCMYFKRSKLIYCVVESWSLWVLIGWGRCLVWFLTALVICNCGAGGLSYLPIARTIFQPHFKVKYSIRKKENEKTIKKYYDVYHLLVYWW